MKLLFSVNLKTKQLLNIIDVTGRTAVRNYAARKGKRMKELKKKKERVVEEKEIVKPYMKHVDKDQMYLRMFTKYRSNEMEKPIDNVYFKKFYKHQEMTVEEALQMHRESHHPAIYDRVNEVVNAFFELDMTLTKKKNKCLDGFTSLVYYPHNCQIANPRKVLAICQRPEDQQAAKEAGAYIVADIDYIEQLKLGEVPSDDFDHCVTTPDLVTRIVPIRGILAKRFPNQAQGSLGYEVGKMVDRFVNSVEFQVKSHPSQPAFGWLEMPVGRLQMTAEQVEENINALIKEVCRHKPLKLGPPIIRLMFLMSPPTREKFLIPHSKYLSEQDTADIEEDEEEAESAVVSKKKNK